MSAPHKQHVSLRGASAKEISRDALLQEVSQERERRNYVRRSTAAALFIQRVWRRYYTMGRVSSELQDEWEALVNSQNVVVTSRWISTALLRPFLVFATMRQKWRTTKVDCMMTCFRIILNSINYKEPEKNFCALSIGSMEEKVTWFLQSKKLVSVCSLILADYEPASHPKRNVVLTALALQLLLTLTDPKDWKAFTDLNIGDAEVAAKNLIKYMMSKRCDLLNSIRRYIMKLDNQTKSCGQVDDNFVITASAITLALRPFHCEKFETKTLRDLEVRDVLIQYCTFLLTVPRLAQRLPAVLVPALRHELVLSPCLNALLILKDDIFVEMSKIDQSMSSYYFTLKIPCAAWALSNIINLATESDHCSAELTGHFVLGLDCRLYVEAVVSILEHVMGLLKSAEHMRKEIDVTGNSLSEAHIAETSDKDIPSELLSNLYMDLVKPVCQQWHLMKLLSVVKKDGSSFAVNDKLKSSGKLDLLNIVYFYSYMLQIFSSSNCSGGLLPILNMLSFTPGFIVEVWGKLESLISSQMPKPHKAKTLGISAVQNKTISELRQARVMKDENKWATMFQKITGRSSNDVNYMHLADAHNYSPRIDEDITDLWDVELLRQGSQGVSRDILYMLHLFCATYSHLLLVLDDIDFYQKQVPFSLEQQRRIAAMLNTFVYNSISHANGQQDKPLIDAAIRCLHLLYERDCRHSFCPPALWVAPARKGRPPVEAAARNHEVVVSTKMRLMDTSTNQCVWSITTTTPHVFPFEERVQMFREYIKLDKATRRKAGEVAGPGPGSIEVVVRRDHIVEDGFAQLYRQGSRLKCSINVSFVSAGGLPEAGLDYGGLSKEFLTDLSKTAFAPEFGLFSQTSSSERSLIPNLAARFRENGIQMMEFLGQIVGKALYEGILLDYSFSLVFVQKLLGRYSFLDELSTMDPELYRNLMYVKHYDGDVKELSLDFSVTEEINGKRSVNELKPGGKDVAVTNDNKLQYVYAVADYKLNKQILPLANAFYRGLVDLISPSWLSLFNANEFNQLLSGGKHDFNVDDLKRNTRYTGGYTEGSRTVRLFWEVISGFEPKERCMLLKFVTSCSRAPLLGFRHLQPAFTIHKVACDVPLWSVIGGQDVDRLPSASTCYNTLKLPTYKRASTMRSKLLYAINSNSGFELS